MKSFNYVRKIKSTGGIARSYCFFEIVRNLNQLNEQILIFRTFLKFSNCIRKAFEDFLKSFHEIFNLKGRVVRVVEPNFEFSGLFQFIGTFLVISSFVSLNNIPQYLQERGLNHKVLNFLCKVLTPSTFN